MYYYYIFIFIYAPFELFTLYFYVYYIIMYNLRIIFRGPVLYLYLYFNVS
jgi:hypothetical protein